MIDQHFEKYIDKISLSSIQNEDALIKYDGVCRSIYKEFYDSQYNERAKFLFGSYKKRTVISNEEKDVDVIFKIPKEKFEIYQGQENGPSNLLTKIKTTLQVTYPATDRIKNWTKVVLVDFQSFKVEVLPALEQENGKFTIPNTGEGQDWICDFDPKKDIDDFNNSNNTTNGLTRNLIKLAKKWKLDKTNVGIKTYLLDRYVIDFLKDYTFISYPLLLLNFFEYLHKMLYQTFSETAMLQSKKAVEYIKNNNLEKASDEYKKIFGQSFPKIETNLFLRPNYQISPDEQFIDSLYPIKINSDLKINFEKRITKNNGSFRSNILFDSIPRFFIEKRDKIIFKAKLSKEIGDFQTKWKVRNFGSEATSTGKLRGEILDDNTSEKNCYSDAAAFTGDHFIECYIIKNNTCIAKERVEIPI
jgi:hypothetical protein